MENDDNRCVKGCAESIIVCACLRQFANSAQTPRKRRRRTISGISIDTSANTHTHTHTHGCQLPALFVSVCLSLCSTTATAAIATDRWMSRRQWTKRTRTGSLSRERGWKERVIGRRADGRKAKKRKRVGETEMWCSAQLEAWAGWRFDAVERRETSAEISCSDAAAAAAAA